MARILATSDLDARASLGCVPPWAPRSFAPGRGRAVTAARTLPVVGEVPLCKPGELNSAVNIQLFKHSP